MIKLPEMWKSVQFPKPGGLSYSVSEFRVFNLHIAKVFNVLGQTLTIDSSGDRQTVGSGVDYIRGLIALEGGGHLAIEEKGSKIVLMYLFAEGVVQLTIESLVNEYQRPDINLPVTISTSYAGTRVFVSTITRYILDSSTLPESVGNVYALLSSGSGIEFSSIGRGGEHLIRENYSAEVLKKYDRIVDVIQAKMPPGRINIMSGPPGTGKSYLIRGLIQQVKSVRFAIVQAASVSSLANPNMLPALLEFRNDSKQPVVFVIEDAEECLATRDAGNNSEVSALLNMGDGILGSLIDLRIIATTNSVVKDLDPAIKRPGRLSTICEVGPLSLDEAAVVYHRLTGKEVFPGNNDTYSIAEIYQMAIDAGWKGEAPNRRKAMGFSSNAQDNETEPLDDSRAAIARLLEEE